MITKPRLVAIVAVAALALGLASPAGAKTDPKKDKSIAQEAVLDLSDFPTGWKDVGPSNDSTLKASSCSKINSAEKSNKKYSASSHDFESPTGFASNAVYVFPTTAAAKAYMKPYASTGEKCLRDSSANDPDLKGAKITVETIDPKVMVDETGADDGLIFRATVGLPGTTAVIIIAGVRIGRAFVGFEFGDTTNKPLPEAEDLLVTSTERLTSALG